MGPRGSFFKNKFKTVKTHKNVLQKTPLKVGIQVAQIGPKFQFLITFDLLNRFWWDQNMLEVGYWSLCSRSGAPSMCTQTAQTQNFQIFFENSKKIQISKTKMAWMCHMGACMRRSLWDVKASSVVNLLSQFFLKFCKKNFKTNSFRNY